MTEADWVEGTDPQPMLEFLRDKISDRKFRLYSVACCRRAWWVLEDNRSKNAVLVAEKFADGGVTDEELEDAYDAASAASYEVGRFAYDAASCAAPDAAESACQLVLLAKKERVARTLILRHIVGNPFRPYSSPAHWPTPVIQLAEAAYQGEPGHFALHDALLEAGYPDLAKHFGEAEHPKGCWALDVILGKQ